MRSLMFLTGSGGARDASTTTSTFFSIGQWYPGSQGNARADLHWALIHQEAVEFGSCFVGNARLAEDDSRHTTALSIGPIGDRGLLDSANGLGKVFLNEREEGSQSVHCSKDL